MRSLQGFGIGDWSSLDDIIGVDSLWLELNGLLLPCAHMCAGHEKDEFSCTIIEYCVVLPSLDITIAGS